MAQTPWLRSPLTDITGGMITHQWYGQCADMELRVMECLEAYGLDRGLKQCNMLIEDFQECANRHKQYSRAFAMRFERHRQYYAGERKREDLYAPTPKLDSY